MDKEDNRQQFINFLRRNKCYERYINNASGYTNIFDYIMKMNEKNWINSLFFYHITPEGSEYWARINNLWISKFQ